MPTDYRREGHSAPLDAQEYRVLEGFDFEPPSTPPPSSIPTEYWDWSSLGILALCCLLVLVGLFVASKIQPSSTLPITRAQQEHCALQKKIAIRGADEKVHCEAP